MQLVRLCLLRAVLITFLVGHIQQRCQEWAFKPIVAIFKSIHSALTPVRGKSRGRRRMLRTVGDNVQLPLHIHRREMPSIDARLNLVRRSL